MNNLRNKVQLIGKLERPPEIITFENGNKLAKFMISTLDTYKNSKGVPIEETQSHLCFCWGDKASLVEKHIKKHQLIAVEGKLKTRTYETKEGETRYRTEVEITEILIINTED